MSEYEKELENTIERLRWIISDKNDKIRDLERERTNLSDALSDAEWKIRAELEPRIEREKRSYDAWVTSGGSDDCMRYGMDGNCGPRCPIFGDKPECTDDLDPETLLEYYIENDVIMDILFEQGLWFDKLKLDWKEDWKAVWRHVKFWWSRLIDNIKGGRAY